MADAFASRPPLGRSAPQVRRSVTLPLNLSASKSSPGTPPAPTPDGAETLFAYHTSRIISFSPPLTKNVLGESRNKRDALEEEPVGVLPWGSHTERTISTSSLRLYKVPGSTAFLQSGRTIHAIMSKSRCWCVDGESKFVLRIRGNNYYRIELPNSTTEDKDAVADFKVVLDRILQYETTACPFKRSFYIELPEKPDIIFKPWTPKHSPITARDAEDQAAASEAGSPTPESAPSFRIEKRTTELSRSSPLLESSPQDSGSEDSVPIPNAHRDDHRVPYVENVVSAYETMKQLQTHHEDRATLNEPEASLPVHEDLPVPEGHQQRAADSDFVVPVMNKQNGRSRSTSPSADRSPSSSAESSNHVADEGNVDSSAPVSRDVEDLPTIDYGQAEMSHSSGTQSLREEERLDVDAIPPKPRRSFTAPAFHHQPTLSSASISSSEHRDETVAEDRASSSSSVKSIHIEEQLPSFLSVEQEEDTASKTSNPEMTSDVSSREEETDIVQAQSDSTDVSEPGSSTPEWLDLSAPSTPQLRSRSGMGNADGKRDLATGHEIDDDGASPRSHLRRRLQQRRELSPMPSLSVLHVPSREHPALDVAVVLFRSVCRTLLVLSMQIVVLLMSIASRQLSPKTGAGNVAGAERHHREISTSAHSDSDSAADDFASVISDSDSSEDDFGVPIGGRTAGTRRTSSGVKARKRKMSARSSSTYLAT